MSTPLYGQGHRGSSYINMPEALIVALAVERLVASGVPAEDIGVMSPYSAQVAVVKRGLDMWQKRRSYVYVLMSKKGAFSSPYSAQVARNIDVW